MYKAITDEMKLKIAKLEADGYKVDIITNFDEEGWSKHLKCHRGLMAMAASLGGSIGRGKSPSEFTTTEFKVTKINASDSQ